MTNYLQPEDDGFIMRESGNWVAEKLDYVNRYFNLFETAMRTRWPIRCYLDLLAGPGKNHIRKSGKVLLGSPLLALNVKHPFTKYYYVEYSAENAEALIQRCQNSPHYDLVDIRIGDCNILVNDIVADVKGKGNQSLNLAFLDPEGFELQWATVAKLATIQRIDLIIYYPQMGLSRLAPLALDTPKPNQIDQFFGGPEWRQIYRTNHTKPGLHRALIDLYKGKLHNLGYEVRRGDEIGNEPLIRHDMTNAPLYRLLFASKHPLGNDFWQKVTQRDIHGQERLL